MQKISTLSLLLIIFLLIIPFKTVAIKKVAPKRLRIGYSISINGITPEKMVYAKSVGVDCIETSLTVFIGKDLNFKISEEEIIEKVKKAKQAADDAGIEIWSIHMPFSQKIDISPADENERQKIVALHEKVLEFCRILKPKIILFHPSWFLGLNEREVRKNQLIKSANELNEKVKDIKAIMVIENMLGYELQVNDKRERPLFRTSEETSEIMNCLPESIYSAIDMNHIKNPETLIRVMGKRLKSVHIADGDGKKECHYFPCSGQGENNWTEILSALQDSHYKGPFMFECEYKDVKELKECYESLYNKFIADKNHVCRNNLVIDKD